MATKLTENYVDQILEELIKEYNLQEESGLYVEYISALMVTKITECEANVSEEEKDDFCILVWLAKPSPLKPQWQYKGVKIFIEVINEIGVAL